MKIIKQKVSKIITLFEAKDGKKFNNEEECKKYENDLDEEKRKKEFNKEITKYEIGFDKPPLNCDAGAFSDLSTYHWMKVKNKKEYNNLKMLLKDEDLKEPSEYPYYYCSEEYYDVPFYEQTEYNWTIDDVINITKDYFKKFNYEIKIERKE